MPPLRIKGRGGEGGGSITDQVLGGSSPSISSEKEISRIEKVSSIFQKEPGDEKLLESSRTSLNFTSGGSFQKYLMPRNTEEICGSSESLRGANEKKPLETSRTPFHSTSGGSFQKFLMPRKTEATCSNVSPTVADEEISLHLTSGSFQNFLVQRKSEELCSSNVSPRAADDKTSSHLTSGSFRKSLHRRRSSNSNVSAGREDKGKSVQRSFRSVCRGGEESVDCRALCIEKVSKRSARAGEEKKRCGRKESDEEDEKSGQYSTRYKSTDPGSSAEGKPRVRESQSGSFKSAGNLASQRDEKSLSKASLSPRITDIMNHIVGNSPVTSLRSKSSCKSGTLQSNSPGLQLVLDESCDVMRINQAKESLLGSSGSSTPNLFERRLSLLEGRVSQIAAELKATKDSLLDPNRNPILSDLQSKVSGIEKLINYKRLAKQCGLMEEFQGRSSSIMGSKSKNFGKFHVGRENVHPSKAGTLIGSDTIVTEQLSLMTCEDAAFSNCIDPGKVGGSAFEERLFPHQRLQMEKRAALQEKLEENSIQLRSKLAALEERDGVDYCAEFISSLKHERDYFGRGRDNSGFETR